MKPAGKMTFTVVWRHFGKGILGLALLAAGLVYLQPFSPRYESRTIRQWIAYNAEHQQLPRREVVRHFGTAAVPILLRESKPGSLFSASVALERVFRSRHFETVQSADFDRRMACADWAQMLKTLEPTVVAELLASNPDNRAALEIATLFFGERELRERLRDLSEQSTDLTVQARAGELLQAYRNMI